MKVPIHIIHAFTHEDFKARGNPTAVIHLQDKLSDKEMQSIASELNQPATTFLWKESQSNTFYIRWFAPDAEIGLCGHGTMGAISSLISLHPSLQNNEINLNYKDGLLTGHQVNQFEYKMMIKPIEREESNQPPTDLEGALGIPILEYYPTANKDIVVTDSENSVKNMKPDFEKLQRIDRFGYAVTAKSEKNEYQFVSRTLVPHVQALEDFATGSSHALLFPYWFEKLQITKGSSLQLSSRGGFFKAEKENDTLGIIGQTYLALEGTYLINS